MAQTYTASPENSTYGHDERGDTGGQSVSQAYTLGTAAADRIVAVFFMMDGGNPGELSNPVFHITGQSDIIPTVVGSSANNFWYIAWAVAPLGTNFTFEATVPSGFGGLHMEYVFSFYGCSPTQFDLDGHDVTSASLTGVNRAAGGTVIAWAFGNTAITWGGTSPVMTNIANRSGIFGSRFNSVGVELDAGAQTGTTISVSSAQRIIVLSLAAPVVAAKARPIFRRQTRFFKRKAA